MLYIKVEKIFLSIVIPAYNEEKRIGDSLRKIKEYLNKESYSYEIIVVDDGSKDETVKKVEDITKEWEDIYVLKNEKNQGKGYSVRRGILSAKGEYILFSDADLSTPIEEVERLINFLKEGYDLAIGSRALKDSKIRIHQPYYRELMGRFFNFFVQVLLFKGIKDTQCGFKVFRREVAKELFSQQKIDGFSFDVEILYLAHKFNYKIKEVPVVWLNSKVSRVNPLKHSLQMFKELLRIRANCNCHSHPFCHSRESGNPETP
ncbi:MAG: glycosyl transferase [Armatimonadetes bacterium CG07_land_8_20_14_0_80_40_9]|nr:MAG: glycosyl transferase [Armatimonadetes bacterium CG07_land_8_20_14_0_80_40_9]